MTVKKVRRKIFNFKKFFCFLLFLCAFLSISYYFSKVPIRNIVILGNDILSDDEVIEISKIGNYPSFVTTLSSSIKKRLKKLPIVKNVSVKKNWGYVLTIEIEEYNVFFNIRSSNEFVLDNGDKLSELTYDLDVPILINYVPDDKLSKLVKKFNSIDYDVIKKISEIEYSPTEYDSERFLFYMRDGNEVYVTLNKINEFGNYSKIKSQLGKKKGILYLDSGNYFEIKEQFNFEIYIILKLIFCKIGNIIKNVLF